ncbi:hypothetical protein ZWY2020_005338 [Hordeum vulgare]|nr:hypothetical protein ZWY2020_005338 [Hordeum vulgare]
MKMIRKQKYLEALDRHDRAKAVDILVKDLKFLVIDVCLIWSCNDDKRIRASMPSIKFLMGKGAKVVLPTIWPTSPTPLRCRSPATPCNSDAKILLRGKERGEMVGSKAMEILLPLQLEM